MYENKGIHRGLFGKIRLVQALRQGQYDVAMLFQNAFEAALWTFLAGIPKRVGFPTDGRHLLLSNAVSNPGKKEEIHQVHFFQELVRQFFGISSPRSPNLVILEEEEIRFAKEVPVLSSGKGNVLIGINPGSVYGTAKRWVPERFAEVADRLLENILAERLPNGSAQCVLRWWSW